MTTLTITCNPELCGSAPTATPSWLLENPNTSGLTAIELCEHVSLTAEQSDALGVLRKRISARLRKAKSREGKDEITLPLPKGTADALRRVMEAADFDDARDFLAFQIHRLDDLLKRDCHLFREQAVRTVTGSVAGLVEKYLDRLTEGEDHANY